MKPLLDFSGKTKACCGATELDGLSVLATSPEKGNLLPPTSADHALLTVIMILHSTSATGGAIDNKIEQAMDLVKSHLLFAVREEVEVLKEQINELLDKNEQLQRENSLLRQSQTQGLAHLPYSQAETPQANRLVNTTATTQDQGGFTSMAGGAPRTDGFTQQPQAPPPTEQFAGMQAAGGPTHAQQAPTQQQALPQQQASQYGHIQQQSTLPQQTPHSIPQQTTTQHAQPPSQT